MNRYVLLLGFLIVGGSTISLRAQECTPASCCDVDACFDAADGGWCQSTMLTGDWGGVRSDLAESGITAQLDLVNFHFGVLRGGEEQEYQYAGHGDYVFNIDGGKALGQEGLFIKVRAEHRFGTGIAESAGVLLPPTVNGDLPTLASENLYLTNVMFTQFLSPKFAVFFGKIDTLDGDVNAFAHGRGKTQFSNVSFVANPIGLRTIPYSSLGAGFVILNDEGTEPIFNFTVMNATDTVRTSGFDELFEEGVAIAAEYRIPTNFFNKPGHQLFAGTWSSREYAALNQDPRIILPQIPINRTDGSWSLYWNFDQFLHVDSCDPTKGWGLFGRAGIADDNANPISYFLSLGVGGNSPLAGRANDRFGAGWFYSGTSDEIAPFLELVTGPIGNSQGVELFYNIEVTPWFHMTPDLQVLMPAREDLDPALLVGARGVITL